MTESEKYFKAKEVLKETIIETVVLDPTFVDYVNDKTIFPLLDL